MKKAQHTPGPWHHEFDKDVGCWCVVSDSRTMPAIYIDQDRDLDEPNARLIAAAPELLEALEFLLATSAALHRETDEVGWASVIQARAAIAKAKGE